MSKTMKYSELTTTTEKGAECIPCAEYKGMVDCLECGDTMCVFCQGECDYCGTEIDWSN